MNHKKKVKLARRMRTPLEEKLRVPIFSSGEWMKRKDAKAKQIIREHHETIGRKGGLKTAKRGSEYYSKIGKKGNLKRQETLKELNNQ